jgi:hypothetical protein
MNEPRNEQQQSQDNQFFDVEILRAEEVAAVSGAAACSYLGVQDWKLMMSYATRNYSC